MTCHVKNVFSIRGCREQRDALSASFGVLTAKCRLVHETIRNVEMNVNKAERIARCVCLLYLFVCLFIYLIGCIESSTCL